MTNDQIQSNTDQNTENKNNNNQVPTNSEVGDHISDTELEPTAGDELAHNIDSEFDNNKKVDLIEELKESNIAMKTEIDKLTKIAATSQSQYVSLKNEFDSYINRIDIEKKEIKLSELKKIVSKFSKLLEQLRLFLSHLDTNLVGDEQVKGLQLIYESFIGQELAQMGIFQINSLGLIPDTELHEVLMVQPATSEDLTHLLEKNIKLDGEKSNYTLEELKGHIISEFEVGYYYMDGEKRIVIKPSKVAIAE